VLAELNVRDFASIERQRVSFAAGFNVISGETGAGKSLLLDALRFCLGARAGQQVLRPGAAEATVEALFYVDGPQERARLLAIAGEVPGLEDGEFVLVRTFKRTGRSRATLNGRLIPVAVLREVGGELMEISSQHDNHLLVSAAAQRELLDAYGGNQDRLRAYQEAFRKHKEALERLEALRGDRRRRQERRESLNLELSLLEQLAPEEGELSRLEDELAILENAGEIQRTLTEAYLNLYERDGSPTEKVGSLARSLRRLQGYLEPAGGLADELDSVESVLKEVAQTCERLREGIDADEERRVLCHERISRMHSLARRLGITPVELPARLVAARAAHERTTEDDRELERLLRDVEPQCASRMLEAGGALSEARRIAGHELAEGLAHELEELGLVGASVEVRLAETSPSLSGLEKVELGWRPHGAAEARSLARIASGGESARVMLALRTLIAGRGSVPTLVFDEIDTGIGGRLGAVIGRKLQALAQRYQVVSITHLAQVASFGDRHLAVSKSVEGGGMRTHVRPVESEARVREIAHMLRGDDLTESTLGEARAMVTEAQEAKE
jgi:DNA repair protein RecN (Recombination protein N)